MRKWSLGAAALGLLAAVAISGSADAAQRNNTVGVKTDNGLELSSQYRRYRRAYYRPYRAYYRPVRAYYRPYYYGPAPGYYPAWYSPYYDAGYGYGYGYGYRPFFSVGFPGFSVWF